MDTSTLTEYGQNSPGRQSGMALLTVLFILVLLSTLAVYTAEDESIAIRRAQNQRDMAQGRQLALAGEQWVARALERDLQAESARVDYFGDEWALLDSRVVNVEDGQMAVQALDESGKFNLNNLAVGKPEQGAATNTPLFLAQSAWYAYFTRLLANLGLNEELADAVVDWTDADDERTEPNGAEDSAYSPARLAANQPFHSIAELGLVEGFDEDTLAIIWPYVTALPVNTARNVYTRININTAPAVILKSLDDSPVSDVLVESVVRSRPGRRYDSANEIYDDLSIGLDSRQFNEIAGVSSDYFSAQSCARFGRIDYALQSLLYRDPGSQEVTVISRQRRYNCGVNRTQ